MTKRTLSQNLGSLFIALAVSACGLMKTQNMQATSGFACNSTGAVQARVSAYTTTVYAYNGACVNCHGSTQPPLFQVGNPGEGWNALSVYFGEDEPLPELYNKLNNGHQGFSPTYTAGLQNQISNYNTIMQGYTARCASGGGNSGGGGGGGNGGGGGGGGGGTPTGPTIEANREFSTPLYLGNLTTTAATKTFTMKAGTKAPFTNIQFTADFSTFDAAGTPTVLMKNLRVISPNSTIRVRNVRFQVGSTWKWDEYGNFSPVNFLVNQGTTATLVSSSFQVMSAIRVGNTSDTLTITAQIDTAVNTELNTFVADVKPVLMQQCAGCHSSVNSFRFNTTTADDALRTLVISKVSKTNVNNSLIFTKAQLSTANGGVNHNGSATATKPLQNDTVAVNKIKAWIMMLP